jgi:hypothetical protein|tara:strand:+ start:113 stop:379 length:267 start_codon:yes stop_codon:yes gene_type:complete
MKDKLKGLVKLNQEKKGSEDELFYFILDQLGKHIDEVKELKMKKDPHLLKEVADMMLLSNMLSINENVSDDIILERINKIEGKIKNEG